MRYWINNVMNIISFFTIIKYFVKKDNKMKVFPEIFCEFHITDKFFNINFFNFLNFENHSINITLKKKLTFTWGVILVPCLSHIQQKPNLS